MTEENQKERIEKFVKRNIDALESMGVELRAQLLLLKEELSKDREFLEKYKAEFGDLRYRPKEGEEYGEPTEIRIRPAVTEFRTTIKSILDSLTLIETKLGVDTGKGGLGSSGASSDDSGDSEEWDVKNWLENTRKTK